MQKGGIIKLAKLLFLFPLFIWADNNLYFSSPNLCARQALLPAKSVYLFIDGFGPGRSATKWAREANQDKTELVKTTWQQLHSRGFYLSKRILELMISKELPIISEAQLRSCGSNINCPEFKKLATALKPKIEQETLSSNNFVQCTWVKKSLPFLMNTKVPKNSDLEELALAYLDKGNYIDNCEKIFSGETKNNSELVLKLDLKPADDWSNQGFEFWRSFKIYLSLFWRQKSTHPALKNQEIVRSFAVDELITLMADGCYSLSKPECNTDFLNLVQLKSTLRKGSFQSSFLMANEIMKKQVSTSDERIRSSAQTASAAVSPRDELLSLMKMRHQSSFQLYKSVRNLSVILNQKTGNEMSRDLNSLIEGSRMDPRLYTLCAEVNKLVRPDLSPFAKELSISSAQVGRVSGQFVLNKNAETLFFKGFDLLKSLQPLCEKVETELKNKILQPDDNEISSLPPARRWFQTLTQYTLPIELSPSDLTVTSPIPFNLASAYVRLKDEVICPSVIDCTRDIAEDLVHIYHVSIYQSVLPNKGVNEITSEQHLGGDVACGLFDPFEQSQLRKKNLVSDLVSSVISGISMLPIYLDLDFQTKNLVSFDQLYQDGKIKFDPQFDEKTVSSTLFLDLGPLAKAPCFLSVSNSSKLKGPNRALLFQGVTFQGCIQNSDGQLVSNSLNIENNKSQDLSACGACSLNFEEVLVATATSNYNIFRFGIRFVGGLVTYFKEENNPILEPIELKINPEFVKEAYLKYNSIPDSCMYELVNGSRCMENICLSYSISQIEDKWNVKVNNASLWNSGDQSYSDSSSGSQSYTDAWVKLDGCEREVRVPINCIQGQKPSSVTPSSSPPSCAKRLR